jgi:hypothetical protein
MQPSRALILTMAATTLLTKPPPLRRESVWTFSFRTGSIWGDIPGVFELV